MRATRRHYLYEREAPAYDHAAVLALKASGKFIPWQVVTISRDGRILE